MPLANGRKEACVATVDIAGTKAPRSVAHISPSPERRHQRANRRNDARGIVRSTQGSERRMQRKTMMRCQGRVG